MHIDKSIIDVQKLIRLAYFCVLEFQIKCINWAK